MRIVSDFHDYYDVANTFSPDLTFVRQTQSYSNLWDKSKNHPKAVLKTYSYIQHGQPYYQETIYSHQSYVKSIHRFVVGFCGKLYPGWEVKYFDGSEHKRVCLYDPKDLLDRFPSKMRNLEAARRFHRWDFKTDEQFLAEFTAQNTIRQDDQLFEGLQAPIFVAYRGSVSYPEVETNPRLNQWEFFRVFSPQQAVQELEMFLGRMIHTEDATLDRTDTLVAESKGFDKWSFRTHPLDAKKPRHRGRQA